MSTNANIIAASIILAKMAETAREEIGEGTFATSGQVVIDVDGSLSVNPEETYKATTSIPMKSVLALFIHYSGITGEHASAALERAMTEALTFDKKTADESILSAIKSVEAREKAVKKVAELSIPDAKRKGKVKFTAA